MGQNANQSLSSFSRIGGERENASLVRRSGGDEVFGWSGDGRALNYVFTRGGVGNIWEQSLTGGPARQITHFKSELIRDFDWSHDGKQSAVARGHLNSNVVLISNFH